MLSKKNRLTTGEVTYVTTYGKVLRTPEFYIRYSTAVNPAQIKTVRAPKFAGIIAKKVEKTSVARHKVRRALYDALAPLVHEFPTTNMRVAITALKPHITLVERNAYDTVCVTLRKEVFAV